MTGGVLPRGRVVAWHDDKPRHERLERLLLLALRCGRQRSHRAPVEGVLQHDDLATGAWRARQLDGALVGLGAGVREEHLAAEAQLRQSLRKTELRLRVEEV